MNRSIQPTASGAPAPAIAVIALLLALAPYLPAPRASAEDRPPTRPAPASPAEIEHLIDALASTSHPDAGWRGPLRWDFAPFAEYRARTGVIPAEAGPPSPTITALVAQGSAAIAPLLAHLGDDRPTRQPVIAHDGGFGGMSFSPEYDRNEARTPTAPAGTCLTMFADRGREMTTHASHDHHVMTVGDLCFFALGQIVNREWSAARYQATAIVVVSSPIRFPALRDAARAEWGGLTQEAHRASLLADVRSCDTSARIEEALIRLGFYFPDSVSDAGVEALRAPGLGAHGLAGVLDALACVRSEEIDAEAWRILRSDCSSVVALACVRRLRGKGRDAELGRWAKALGEAKTLR